MFFIQIIYSKQMKSLLIFVFILFHVQISCLLIDRQQNVHLQTAAEQQAYLAQLLKIENTLQQQLTDLENYVGFINKNVSSYEGSPTIQTQTLQFGIDGERDKLQQMSSKLVIPLEKRTWDCKMLTQTEVDAINKQISDTQKNIVLLQQKVDAEPDCQKNNQILTQIEFLNIYLDHLVKQVGSNCGNSLPPAPKAFYIPSSTTQNYIYGDQGQDAYNKKIQDLLNQQYTKIQCPPQHPFPKAGACVACLIQKNQFYDLTKQACMTCPSGYRFSHDDKKCVRQVFNSNTQDSGGNFIGKLPALITGVETCPIVTPFFNGVSCISCPTPSFFDFNDNLCKKCPQNTTFDANTHMCLYKKYNVNTASGNNYCCGILINDPKADTCPKETPFFNGKQCVSCALPAYFNIQSLICSLCPSGQGFSLTQSKCIDNKYLQPYYTTLIRNDVQNYIGNAPQVDPQYQKVLACPIEKPFWTGTQCVSCALPYYYNFNDNQCQICPPENTFDISVKKCVKLQTNQLNSNMAVINNFFGTVPAFNTQLSTCPSDRPFYDGNQCISCSLPQFIDFNSLTCKSCQSGKTFNIDNRQCVFEAPSFYTRTSSDNIFYNGNFSTVINQVQSLKQKYPNIQQCPVDSPYFNAQRNICITCAKQYPLWDIKYNRCINCPEYSTYNKQNRICLMNGGVDATVERMIMNTVGWM